MVNEQLFDRVSRVYRTEVNGELSCFWYFRQSSIGGKGGQPCRQLRMELNFRMSHLLSAFPLLRSTECTELGNTRKDTDVFL